MAEFAWQPDNPLGRALNETRKAHTGLRDYWAIGPGRSIRKLHQMYMETTSQEPPTRVLRTILGWSTKYSWQDRIDRAKEIADDEIAELERQVRRDTVLTSGFALRYERVAALQALADLLQEELLEEDKRWLPDVKQIGGGEYAERVDIVRFNNAIIEQFRKTLEDIAAEMGDRVQRQEHEVRAMVEFDLEAWQETRDERLAQVAQMDDAAPDG